jgi:hypothetical protein
VDGRFSDDHSTLLAVTSPARTQSEQQLRLRRLGWDRDLWRNPVEQARRLNRSDIKVQVNIVGFDVDINAARQLRHATRSGGGKYFQATDAGDLDRIFRDNYNWAKWTA